jgi:hypothetical protein
MTKTTRECVEHLPPNRLDGTQVLFETIFPYIPGSVFLFAPDLRPRSDILEVGPQQVRLLRPPHRGDTIFLWYLTYSLCQ